jgi:hypothetical protein
MAGRIEALLADDALEIHDNFQYKFMDRVLSTEAAD